jgi:hypothetical protein
MNFVQKDGIIMLIGKKFNILLPYFEDPINSTIIDIFKIKNKMMVLHYSGVKIAMPIIHTDI